MINALQINIEIIPSTHFEKMKLCAFILAVFKNDNDCMMIDIPLNEIIPQMAGAVDVEIIDSSLAPRVTSKIPNKKLFIS